MIKRRLGETLAARSTPKQNRAMMLKVITHNLMIILQAWVFYRALLTPFLFEDPRIGSETSSELEDNSSTSKLP